MKLSLLSLLTVALSASAAPAGSDFSLEGFGKDNPIGPTTGGAGKDSKTVTVTTVPEFLDAIKGTSHRVRKSGRTNRC
jgi:pectate lyase